jgi:hypothetical protein
MLRLVSGYGRAPFGGLSNQLAGYAQPAGWTEVPHGAIARTAGIT